MPAICLPAEDDTDPATATTFARLDASTNMSRPIAELLDEGEAALELAETAETRINLLGKYTLQLHLYIQTLPGRQSWGCRRPTPPPAPRFCVWRTSRWEMVPGGADVAPLVDNITKDVIFDGMMTGERLRQYRRNAGWTQSRLAARLGVAQAYVSMMERGTRPVPEHLARRVASLLRLPASALPLPRGGVLDKPVDEDWVAVNLARLGYSGFRYLARPGRKRHPAEVLLRALALRRLEPRLAEALAWLLLQYDEFDAAVLVTEAKSRDLQNRLGFTVSLARDVARGNSAYGHRLRPLEALEEMLKPSRLAGEDIYGSGEMSEVMLAWARKHRSKAAAYWNLLTDLKTEHLPYARSHP